MPNPVWVRSKTLEELFKVGPSVLLELHRKGFLEGVIIADQRHFHIQTINTFLASRPQNLVTPPRLEDLLSGELVLFKAEEAAAYLHLGSLKGLHHRRLSNRILGIQLGRHWRFSQTSVEECRQADLNEELLSPNTVCHIIGQSTRTINKLIAEARLECMPSPIRPSYKCIVLESLLRFLSESLPEWIDPLDWIDDRLHDTRPLIGVPEALIQLGTNRRDLNQLLAGQHITYIYNPAHSYLSIAPESIDGYLYHCQPLTSTEIAKLFGTSAQSVNSWLRDGLLICPIESHDHTGDARLFYPACMVAVLREQLSPNVQPIAWYRTRLQHGGKLIPCPNAVAVLGVPYKTLLWLAETNQIRGIRTPAGTWMFTEGQLAKVRQRLRRAGSAS